MLAVIDWEVSTLGDPLTDLATNCIGYHITDQRAAIVAARDYFRLFISLFGPVQFCVLNICKQRSHVCFINENRKLQVCDLIA